MGFNPFRPREKTTGDVVMVAVALAVIAAAVLWALFSG